MSQALCRGYFAPAGAPVQPGMSILGMQKLYSGLCLDVCVYVYIYRYVYIYIYMCIYIYVYT